MHAIKKHYAWPSEQFLTAGVEEDGTWSKTVVVGTPQGSVISPLYANIYLHYVLDLWVNQWRKKRARCEVYIVRFADDFVVGFQYKTDGEQFHQDLQTRMVAKRQRTTTKRMKEELRKQMHGNVYDQGMWSCGWIRTRH